MKNLFLFYLLITAPLATIVLLAKALILTSNYFVLFMGVFCFIYHPLLVGLRLIAIGAIKPVQLGYTFIPGWNWKYFSLTFFNHGLAKRSGISK